MCRTIIQSLVAIAFLTSCGPSDVALRTVANEPPSRTSDAVAIGVCQHHNYRSPGTTAQLLDVVREAGLRIVRDDLFWHRVERERGVYIVPEHSDRFVDDALARGIEPMLILCYGNALYAGGAPPRDPETIDAFARYAEHCVRHFRGRVRLWQVWNEWDGGTGMAKPWAAGAAPAEYVPLLAAVAPRLRAIDPEITIIANSFNTGLSRFAAFCAAGGLAHCDAAAIHLYNHKRLGGLATPEHWRGEVATALSTIATHSPVGHRVPLYVTEMGYPTHAGAFGRDPDLAAAYAARCLLLARTLPGLAGVLWYDLFDDGWQGHEQEHHFGLLRADHTPKPAMAAVAGATRFAGLAEEVPSPHPALRALRLRAEDGLAALALWSTGDDLQVRLDGVPVGNARIARIGSVSLPLVAGPEGFSATVGQHPVLIYGIEGAAISACVPRPVPAGARGLRRAVPPPLVIPIAAGAEPDPRHGAQAAAATVDAWRSLREGVAWGGADDCSLILRAAWDRSGLHLLVDVADDHHHPPTEAGSAMWRHDSIQVAVMDLDVAGDARERFTELCIATTPTGPAVFRHVRQSGSPAGLMDVPCTVTREAGRTIYRVSLPWTAVELPAPMHGRVIGFSALVNDDDGDGRKGSMQIGGGIAGEKDPGAFAWLVLAAGGTPP